MKLSIKILLFFTLLINQEINGQKSVMANYRYDKLETVKDSITGSFLMGVTYVNRDTIKIFNGKYEVKSKNNVLLVDSQIKGGMGTECGCESKIHGLCIERYRNGNLKETGDYYCNEKIGKWIYYHESGNMKRIESYLRPYSVDLSDHRLDFIFQFGDLCLNNKTIKSGPFKEYYENGQIKQEGHYRIIEEYSQIDSIFTYDPETYEKQVNIIEGEFWHAKSIKTGKWNYYDKRGKLLNKENLQFSRIEKKYRSIKRRYYEIFEIIKNSTKTKK